MLLNNTAEGYLALQLDIVLREFVIVPHALGWRFPSQGRLRSVWDGNTSEFFLDTVADSVSEISLSKKHCSSVLTLLSSDFA
jgi:hypothetical protein